MNLINEIKKRHKEVVKAYQPNSTFKYLKENQYKGIRVGDVVSSDNLGLNNKIGVLIAFYYEYCPQLESGFVWGLLDEDCFVNLKHLRFANEKEKTAFNLFTKDVYKPIPRRYTCFL